MKVEVLFVSFKQSADRQFTHGRHDKKCKIYVITVYLIAEDEETDRLAVDKVKLTVAC